MDEFEKFRSMLFQLISEMIRSKLEESNGKVEENLVKELLDIETNHVRTGKWSQRDTLLMEIFHGFIEIDSSYMTLKDIEIYIVRFPYRKTNLSKSKYIKYHIANYLNEMYILTNRLTAYVKKLSRFYKRDLRHQAIKQLTDGISKIIEEGFNDIVKIRGIHVHISRYMDKDILRLGALEALVERGDKTFVKVLTPDHQRKYTKIKNEWETKIKKNNGEIRKIINSYFSALSKVLFDKNGKLICPHTLNKPLSRKQN